MAEDDQRLFAGTLPLDDVVSGTVDLAGHVAELIDRLGAAIGALSGPQSIQSWRDAIAAATESLAAVAPADGLAARPALPGPRRGRRRGRAGRRLLRPCSTSRRLAPCCRTSQGPPDPGQLPDRRSDRCTLVPMRSVPHRVVGLLGLDDGVFPRHTARDGDDCSR